MAGLSAVGFVMGVVGHNLAYAGAEVFRSVLVVYYFFEVVHVLLFLVAVVVCPVGFFVGVLGVVVRILSGKKVMGVLGSVFFDSNGSDEAR